MRHRVTFKLLVIFELALLVTVLVLVIPGWLGMSRQVVSNMQNELKAIASTGALEIDGDLHAQIRNPEDADSEAFRTIRAQLEAVRRANDLEVEHVYTFYRDGDDLVRFAVMVHERPFVGDPYPLQPLMRSVFEAGTMTATELYEDEHGQWISAYAPVRDRAGNVVGLLEVDKDSETYFAAYRVVWMQTFALGLLVLAISSLAGWLVLQRTIITPLRAVREGMLALGRQDFGHRVRLTTKDEFGQLGDTLNDISSQLDVANLVQASFFPDELPKHERWAFAASSVPCDATGGDYYDAFTMDDGRIVVLVADVSGHGLGPSLLMATCRSALHALCTTGPNPAELIEQLDRLLTPDLSGGRFITMIVGMLEPDGRFTFANAGHGPAMVVRNGVVETLDSHAAPIGLLGLTGTGMSESTVQLQPGDRVFLASDGVSECMSPAGELFGDARIERIVAETDRSPAEVVERMQRALIEHAAGRPASDDVTMLCVDRR